MQTNFEKDVVVLLNKMKTNQDPVKYHSYIQLKKNIIYSNDENIKIIKTKEEILKKQKSKEIIVKEELQKFDEFGIPFIGMKGPFIKSEYYGTIPRIYNDLDLLVSSDNAQCLYYNLKHLGYRIKTKTMYDNPVFNMKYIPKKYMENTQTLMMINKSNGISIDMHSNLNITNAHFVKTSSNFSTCELFKNSQKFEHYNNILQLELHDNLCFVIRHLLKHHIFYGKTQTGLRTILQHLMDFAVLLNSTNFSEEIFKKKIIEYNIIPETIFCILLYNNIFISGRKINISDYISLFNSSNEPCKWYPIIEASLKMDITDIIIGNYEKYFPKIYKSVEFCQNIPNYKIGWTIQALFLNPIVIKYLSK